MGTAVLLCSWYTKQGMPQDKVTRKGEDIAKSLHSGGNSGSRFDERYPQRCQAGRLPGRKQSLWIYEL